ncbi:ubiquinone/menaquinone biosynthesis C-methylase UbiE [Pedobacter sp. CAN_A7]|uniref:class I SAM-dependent methyltransferase n=1 Tax=Pedobacter sp. CAN_A7 TaxID=2787722 RepID=UPI0018CA17F2
MVNNYDRIASSYDRLSRLVFFKAQTRAQKVQLPFIQAGANILIVGGGTGWILAAIAEIHPKGLNITFIDISANMINLAKKVNAGENKVLFIQGAIEELYIEHPFDVVITAFLFDNFAETRATLVFHKLHQWLKDDGLWFFADFSPLKGKAWHSILLKLMYAFFNRIAQVEAHSLFNTNLLFQQHAYRNILHNQYYGNFIESIVYKKTRP